MPKQSEILLELEKACKASHRVENLCRDFELQKVCYIPLNVFVLRPLHRLIHYKQILERLCKHYPATHMDFRDCRGAIRESEDEWGVPNAFTLIGQGQSMDIKMAIEMAKTSNGPTSDVLTCTLTDNRLPLRSRVRRRHDGFAHIAGEAHASPWQHHGARVLAQEHKRVHGGL
ncbi:hypothetical protein GOODEAATRI_019735 [Goodea atripinnis]|uniref:DH domain-containing protein n=1 Tax=Goodea atripinnis TaxID=208336 RepID=A0ABV0P695_9TELE